MSRRAHASGTGFHRNVGVKLALCESALCRARLRSLAHSLAATAALTVCAIGAMAMVLAGVLHLVRQLGRGTREQQAHSARPGGVDRWHTILQHPDNLLQREQCARVQQCGFHCRDERGVDGMEWRNAGTGLNFHHRYEGT